MILYLIIASKFKYGKLGSTMITDVMIDFFFKDYYLKESSKIVSITPKENVSLQALISTLIMEN